MNNLEIGDVVTLKSGSLPLTVTFINAEKNNAELFFSNLQGDLVKVVLPVDCVEYTDKRWSIMDIDADIDDEDGEF
jgi:hypothetical protein